MMISPQAYVDEFKNEPFEKLIKERERLYKELKRIEKDAFDSERKSDACPTVRSGCFRRQRKSGRGSVRSCL